MGISTPFSGDPTHHCELHDIYSFHSYVSSRANSDTPSEGSSTFEMLNVDKIECEKAIEDRLLMTEGKDYDTEFVDEEVILENTAVEEAELVKCVYSRTTPLMLKNLFLLTKQM